MTQCSAGHETPRDSAEVVRWVNKDVSNLLSTGLSFGMHLFDWLEVNVLSFSLKGILVSGTSIDMAYKSLIDSLNLPSFTQMKKLRPRREK